MHMNIYTAAIKFPTQIKYLRKTPVLNFKGNDSFELSEKNPLELNGASNPRLNGFVEEFLKMPNASYEHLELLKNVASVIYDDKDGLSKSILSSLEKDSHYSPKVLCADLKANGLDLLSLDPSKFDIYNQNIDNFKNSKYKADVDLKKVPALPLLSEKQIEKVSPYISDDVFCSYVFDIANADNNYTKRLDEFYSIINDLYEERAIKFSPEAFSRIMNSKLPDEELQERFFEVDNFIQKSGAPCISKKDRAKTSCAIKNIILLDESKYDTAEFLMNFDSSCTPVKLFINVADVDKISALEENDVQKIKEFLDIPRTSAIYLNGDDLVDISKLNNNQYERFMDFASRGSQNSGGYFGAAGSVSTKNLLKIAKIAESEAQDVYDNSLKLDFTQADEYVDICSIADMSALPMARRIDIVSRLDSIREAFERNGIKDELFEKRALSLESSLASSDVAIEVPRENVVRVFKTLLSNIPQKQGLTSDFDPKLTQTENILLKSESIIRECGTDGLPLRYSRNEYMEDLNSVFENLTASKKEEICNKLGIVPINVNAKMTGYNGLLRLKKLDLNDSAEKAVYDITYNFLYSNKVQTRDEDLNKVLNTIIFAFPEFINSIGKKQASEHVFSNDVHSLVVLNQCISNPEYKNLSNEAKTVTKLLALFHDVGKTDGGVDKGHQTKSAYYLESILKKLNISPNMADRICELVKNHHWFEGYNTGRDGAEVPAFMFRKPEDFKIAQIFARADLIGVGSPRLASFCYNLNPENMSKIQNKIDKIIQSGNAIYTYGIVSKQKIPTEKSSDGNEYRVINFTKIGKDEDCSKYGYKKGVKLDDIKFPVHMIETGRDLKRLKYLTNINTTGVLSESVISLDKKKTYCSREYGVVLEHRPYDIIQMSDSNIGSGVKKDYNYAIKACQSEKERNNFRNAFLDELNLTGKVSEKDYGEFYLKHLMNKNTLSQFENDNKYKIGQYEFTSQEIKQALENTIEHFTVDSSACKMNCELVAYNPKITALVAKEDNLDDTPQYFRDYAKENDLPIFLVGRE